MLPGIANELHVLTTVGFFHHFFPILNLINIFSSFSVLFQSMNAQLCWYNIIPLKDAYIIQA